MGSNGTQAFSPNPAGFGGQTVVFKNNDSVSHRVVLNDGSVDTGDIAPGATSRAVAMPASGTNYHCQIHPGMIGAVSGGAGAPPACVGLYCDPY
jgi:plastocyanin